MQNVMIDLEALGNCNNAVIVSIGAVEFDESGIGREFYVCVDPVSCEKIGLKINASTVMWWLSQEKNAINALVNDQIEIQPALVQLSEWMTKDADVWGCGAVFDNVILSNAYEAAGIEKPWNFWNDKCFRTMRDMFPNIPYERMGTHHNALDDAKTQALHAVKILNFINNK